MFTLGNWIAFILIFIVLVVVALMISVATESIKTGVISLVVLFVLLGVGVGITGWYNTNTASGQRALKDFKSELNNGIDREIVITAEDGREIFRYEGKVDIESNHTDNYIKFESEEGKRYIIYYGIQDTITIIEK